jgi:hypothetical protein
MADLDFKTTAKARRREDDREGSEERGIALLLF